MIKNRKLQQIILTCLIDVLNAVILHVLAAREHQVYD